MIFSTFNDSLPIVMRSNQNENEKAWPKKTVKVLGEMKDQKIIKENHSILMLTNICSLNHKCSCISCKMPTKKRRINYSCLSKKKKRIQHLYNLLKTCFICF